MARPFTAVFNTDAGERSLVAAIRQRAGQGGRPRGTIRLGIGDDCAVLWPRRGHELVVTTDLSLETVHFRRDWHPAGSVGHRCLARGLSDLAAMGARPEAAFLSLAVPGRVPKAWLDEFFRGFFALADRWKVQLAGGDLGKFPRIVADIVLLGSAPKGKALLRSGAKPGDVIYVTGTLGGSAAALQQLRSRRRVTSSPSAGDPHLYPEPRLTIGRKLVGLATACIDLSDGLSTDLGHLCEESGVGAEIVQEALPVDARASLDQALHGGEDYELLFCAPSRTAVPSELAGVSVTAIGRVKKRTSGAQMELLDGRRRKQLRAAGWEHFRSKG
jgi:thiamine-monophosphate kinase